MFVFDNHDIFIKFSESGFLNNFKSEIRIFGCRCLDLANLSSGKIDCFISEEELNKNADAGMLFIKESGGIVYKKQAEKNIFFYSNNYITDILNNKL